MFSGTNKNSDGISSQYVALVGGMQSAGASTEATGVITSNASGPGGIDWAQLAQQWIQMRDTAAPNIAIAVEQPDFSIPLAPPPPIISAMSAYQTQKAKHQNFVEQGEADMEMDDDVDGERRPIAGEPSPPPPAPHVTQSQWFAGERSDEMSIRSHNNAQWHMWPPRVDVPPPAAANCVPTESHINNPTAHIPSLLKINVTNPNDPNNQHTNSDNPVVTSNSSGVDASKRKLLPAWIREGLEKMEREKQRQMERQQPNIKESIVSTYNSCNDLPLTTKTTPVNLLHKINVASESESGNDDDDDHDDKDEHVHVVQVNTKKTPRGTRGSDSDAETHAAADNRRDLRARSATASPHNSVIGKSYEQKLADLMSVVRRTLTELLLETTNEEIASVAQDALKAQRAKASSAQVIRKSALSSITGKLGLAAYADSSSDNESSDAPSDGTDNDDDVDIQSNKKTDIDSEEELKSTIRAKRRAFAKTIEEIEERIALAEQREEQQLKHHRQLEREKSEKTQKSNKKYAESHCRQNATGTSKSIGSGSGGGGNASASKGYERDFGETTTTSSDTKLQQYNGKRINRKERQTRFSDNKDNKNGTAVNATPSYLNHLQQLPNIVGDGTSASGNGNTGSSKMLLPIPNVGTSLLQTSDTTTHLTTAGATTTATAANSGMMNILNAAHAALEKATQKTKASAKRKRRRRSSSTSSSDGSSTNKSSSSSTTDSSTDSDDKTCSSTSRNSKHSHRSSGSRRRYELDTGRDRRHRRHNKYKSSRERDSYKRRDRGYSPERRHTGSSSSRRRRPKHYSSDSDDGDYQRDIKRRRDDEKRRKRSRSRSSYSSSRGASEQQKQRSRH